MLVISPKVVSPATIGVALFIIINFIAGKTFTDNTWLVMGYCLSTTIFAISHFIPKLKFGIAIARYTIIYHILLAFLLIFIVPTPSYYLYLWVILMYISEYYFQSKGVITSTISLIFVIVIAILYQNDGLNGALVLKTIPDILIIITVNMVMSRLAFGNRQQRKDIANKLLHAEYEHGRLVALINSVRDAVIATDESGKILTYNAAALDILNTNLTLKNLNIDDILKLVDTNNNKISVLDLARNTKTMTKKVDLSIPVSSEDKVDLEIIISRIVRSSALASQQGYVFLFRDITKQKSLDEERELFITEVSHEIRTPMTIAEGNISMALLLADNPQPKINDIKNATQKAHDQIVLLSELINDLSTLSRAQHEDKDMDIETFDVKEVLQDLKAQYTAEAQKKNIYFDLIYDSSAPKLTTSKHYFQEIMQNFISNAIKYTKNGGVTIQCHPLTKNTIKVSVKDTGIGIPKSEQSKIFEKFWRSEDAYTRSSSGTGLGLYIATKIADRIGARITLDSQINEGSTFSVILPVDSYKTIDQKNVVKNEVAHIFE